MKHAQAAASNRGRRRSISKTHDVKSFTQLSKRSHTVRNPFLKLGWTVLALTLAASAFAVPPASTIITIEDYSYTDSTLCAFDVTFTENGSFKFTLFFDSAGHAVKSIISNYQGNYTDTASANGKTLTSMYMGPYITSVTDGTQTQLGLRDAFTLPGAGVILLDAGRVVRDLDSGSVSFQSGPHQRISGPSTSAFCDYFLGP